MDVSGAFVFSLLLNFVFLFCLLYNYVSGPLFLLLVAVGDHLFSLWYLEGLGFGYVFSDTYPVPYCIV